MSLDASASTRKLARPYSVALTTIQKWRKRKAVTDAPIGQKGPRTTVFTPNEKTPTMAYRHQTLLPLDDCLYGLQPSIQHLTRSSLRRWLQRHSISRLP